jgi:hypothetical protein
MKLESARHPEYVAPDGARNAYGPASYKDAAPDGAGTRTLERGRQFTPGSDYLRQVAPVIAGNLCAWLCIAPFTIIRNRLIFSRL